MLSRIVGSAKKQVNKVLSRYGYRIERVVDYRVHAMDVFQLAVQALSPGDPGFYFVQVGAHDGRTGDPVHKLVTHYHWRGLLLEPQPDVFVRLKENYEQEPQLDLVNLALATEDGPHTLYTAKGATLRASLDRAAFDRHLRSGVDVIEVPVQAVTFKTLRQRYSLDRVDVLLVDTEGFDYQVVRMALDEGIRPRLVRYEHLHLSSHDRAACATLLAGCGYRLLRDGIDTLAMRDDVVALT